MWQLIAMFELMGRPREGFWLMYLDSVEYEEYRLYRKVKRFLRDGLNDKAKEALEELEGKEISKRPFLIQFVACARILAREDISHDEELAELDKAMRMTIPDFGENKLSELRMTHNEFLIAISIAVSYAKNGEFEKSALLTKSLIECRENARASEEDKAALFPPLMFNMSTMLGRMGRLKESLELCEQALEMCKEYNNLRFIPGILYTWLFT